MGWLPKRAEKSSQSTSDATNYDGAPEFVRALAKERGDAAVIEQANPQTHAIDGALNWKNGDIDGFLFAALEYFEPKPFHQPEREPSWRMFAEFLWCGKIIE